VWHRLSQPRFPEREQLDSYVIYLCSPSVDPVKVILEYLGVDGFSRVQRFAHGLAMPTRLTVTCGNAFYSVPIQQTTIATER
jgi:hypothetical protein